MPLDRPSRVLGLDLAQYCIDCSLTSLVDHILGGATHVRMVRELASSRSFTRRSNSHLITDTQMMLVVVWQGMKRGRLPESGGYDGGHLIVTLMGCLLQTTAHIHHLRDGVLLRVQAFLDQEVIVGKR